MARTRAQARAGAREQGEPAKKKAKQASVQEKEGGELGREMASARHILITGKPGTGKSTLVSKLVDEFKAKGVALQGFWTKEVRKEGNRIGFDVVTLDGKEAPLSRVGSKGPRVGKYGVHVADFEALALPCLRLTEAASRDAPRLIIVDEIGKMELFSKPFMAAYRRLLDTAAKHNAVVVSTIAQRGEGFIAEIKGRPDVDLEVLTKANRDAKCAEIAARLAKQLQLPS